MIDAALIQQCADPTLKPAIVELFIERAGSQEPLAVSVRSGNRVVLVPQAKTVEAAMTLVRQHVGNAIVRVGVTQYPAGLGITDASELKPDLVDTCANLRMGTKLFAKVYRIVTKWYGNPTEKEVIPQVFDDAIIAWQTGYFEGTSVFRAPDPGEVKLAEPTMRDDASAEASEASSSVEPAVEEKPGAGDPNKAEIRIDLSGIGGRKP